MVLTWHLGRKGASSKQTFSSLLAHLSFTNHRGFLGPNPQNWEKPKFGSQKTQGILTSQYPWFCGYLGLTLPVGSANPHIKIYPTVLESNTVIHRYASKRPKSPPTNFPHWGNPCSKGVGDSSIWGILNWNQTCPQCPQNPKPMVCSLMDRIGGHIL